MIGDSSTTDGSLRNVVRADRIVHSRQMRFIISRSIVKISWNSLLTHSAEAKKKKKTKTDEVIARHMRDGYSTVRGSYQRCQTYIQLHYHL